MMILKKIFGLKTKDLFLAELVIGKIKYDNETKRGIKSFSPKRYVLVKKEGNDYEDVLTYSKYKFYKNCYVTNDEMVVANLEPIITEKKRINYKDADKMFKTTDCSY
ncbi:MAG: hypothetical protein RSB54_00565, partial [Bacilli bacterium]